MLKKHFFAFFYLVGISSLFVTSCRTAKHQLPEKHEVIVETKTITDTVEIIRIDTIVQTEKVIERVYVQEPKAAEPYSPKTPINAQEFRGAWVATVANINWPSKPGLSTAQQKQEAIQQLDFLANHHFNAVIFQVRPQADALYKSDLEPWSYYLTGEQGKAPEPFYDPLAFWIEEAHKRGLELHAWLNPYRAHHTANKSISKQSIVKTNPKMVIPLANGMVWMDPANPAVQQRSLAVVRDIVQRYNVDGIHFDDYFYPYDSYNNGKDFPDEESWQTYQKTNGSLSRNDWRRSHVNHFIKRVYETIKQEKPAVKFGISPFGIWRPGYPQDVRGYDQYDKLFADAKLWLNEGWVDYFTPQLYWSISKPQQSFPELLAWWQRENTKKKQVWPGINAGLDKDGNNEIMNQIFISRGMNHVSPGTIHWSLGTVMKNEELAKQLKEVVYKQRALVPASQSDCARPPSSPASTYQINQKNIHLTWQPTTQAKEYVLYYQYQHKPWQYVIIDGGKTNYNLPKTQGNSPLKQAGITAVSPTNCQSLFTPMHF